VGRLTRSTSDLCLVLGQVGLTRASSDPCLVELGFSSWLGYFGFGSMFLGWIGFWVKNHGLCSTRGFLRIKNYGQYPAVVLVGLNQVFFWRFE
jgi:hypothetical protein